MGEAFDHRSGSGDLSLTFAKALFAQQLVSNYCPALLTPGRQVSTDNWNSQVPPTLLFAALQSAAEEGSKRSSA
jgi:hypothetical protein